MSRKPPEPTAPVVRELGIIFSAPGSVAGILAGTKTQTRRLVKSISPIVRIGTAKDWNRARMDSRMRPFEQWGPRRHLVVFVGGPSDEAPGGHHVWAQACPYGVPGDRLWVRETWRISSSSSASSHSPRDVHFRSDPDEVSGGPWRSPYHMPRWASRVTLEVTEVRVQRLQGITEEDAAGEGITLDFYQELDETAAVRRLERLSGRSMRGPRVDRFAKAWESFNGKRAPWASNPWVWAITFRRVV